MNLRTYTHHERFDEKLRKCTDRLANYVLATYGPYGQNVLISENGKSYLTKDGVTVAKNVFGDDETEDAILQIMKQAAEKTLKDAGDGTTTSIFFLREFIAELKSALEAFKTVSTMEVYDVYKQILGEVCIALEKASTPVRSRELLHSVAFVASNGDKTIAELVTELIDNVGVGGSISIKDSRSKDTYSKIMEGMKFNSSIMSNNFLPDTQEKLTLSDCVIVVSNCKVSLTDDFIHLMSDCVANKKSLLIVCPEMDEKALVTLLYNVTNKAIQACVVTPGYMGKEKLEVFEDISLIAGTVVNSTAQLSRIKAADWGYAKNVEIVRGSTSLLDGAGKAEVIDNAIETLKNRLQSSEDEFENTRMINRINRLTSTVGVLFVGGTTPAEATERKHRVEDALESCFSALKKGVVPGAGTMLKDCVENLSPRTTLLEQFVLESVKRICSSQCDYLYDHKEGFRVGICGKQQIFDLRTRTWVEPIQSGIIESVWTVQSALTNAFSAAFVLINSWGSIV